MDPHRGPGERSSAGWPSRAGRSRREQAPRLLGSQRSEDHLAPLPSDRLLRRCEPYPRVKLALLLRREARCTAIVPVPAAPALPSINTPLGRRRAARGLGAPPGAVDARPGLHGLANRSARSVLQDAPHGGRGVGRASLRRPPSPSQARISPERPGGRRGHTARAPRRGCRRAWRGCLAGGKDSLAGDELPICRVVRVMTSERVFFLTCSHAHFGVPDAALIHGAPESTDRRGSDGGGRRGHGHHVKRAPLTWRAPPRNHRLRWLPSGAWVL